MNNNVIQATKNVFQISEDDRMPINTMQNNIYLSEPASFFKGEDDEHFFTLDIAAPGYYKDEIEISMIHGILRVSANKKRTSRGHNCRQIIEEVDTDSIERLFKLAKEVQHEHIDATYRNGIIHLKFSPGNEKDVYEVELK